ncbi:Zinc knuckle CX2CX4HX4C [Corchorus olitorius]|uniref:Zinc knuckle CX2CX4HX4C n=1 Tax=Corchorus olitorius TaxID=93759 RepID=A0A1R3KW22_9ROSI|nr:Zinc knuckle CX2CX4HX4C [Corchorus olitorius]
MIAMDVTKPLRRVIPIKGVEGIIKGRIAYERLSNFCKVCGLLNHNVMDCEDPTVEKAIAEGVFQYEPWLCTSPLKRKKEGVSHRLLLDTGKTIDGGRQVQTVAECQQGNAGEKFSGFGIKKGAKNMEAIGDNLAGILDRERMQFDLNLKVSDEETRGLRDLVAKKAESGGGLVSRIGGQEK